MSTKEDIPVQWPKFGEGLKAIYSLLIIDSCAIVLPPR